jgi:hypothetical protein
VGSAPPAVGNRIAQSIIDVTVNDGACEDRDYECLRVRWWMMLRVDLV